jgi:predicted helicase
MGIAGIITNNSFLDGVTHRQMRKHLYETFDEIYILNLHGNTRKGEADKNIFDIMVGVSICIFVKHKVPKEKKVVKYFSTMDNKITSRIQKLSFLKKKKLNDVK